MSEYLTTQALPTCDNECALLGWTQHFEVEVSCGTMLLSTEPDVDLDDEYLAFNHDLQEVIRVKGWLTGEMWEV